MNTDPASALNPNPAATNIFTQMWEALRNLGGAEGSGSGSGSSTAVLVLQPDESAKASIAGFKSGASLRIAADAPGQTITQILAKLNKYRGPDQQIRRIWTTVGEEIVGSTVPTSSVVGIVKASSV